MALSNKERVGRVLDNLREGLPHFILQEYNFAFKYHFWNASQEQARMIKDQLQQGMLLG